MDIRNRVIIVTGASQGIGMELAKLLTQEGAQVVLAARSVDILQHLEQELGGALAVPTDMRHPADIKNLIETTMRKFDRIDILINNAAQGLYGSVETIDLDAYRQVMELNVMGPLQAMQAVIPIMRSQGSGGMIVNISSRVSKNYFPNLAGYASTKYALNALSLTAREELAKDNIVVSVMHPKMTATEFRKHALGEGHLPDGSPSNIPEIDSPEAVAERIIELIRSEEAEVEM